MCSEKKSLTDHSNLYMENIQAAGVALVGLEVSNTSAVGTTLDVCVLVYKFLRVPNNMQYQQHVRHIIGLWLHNGTRGFYIKQP